MKNLLIIAVISVSLMLSEAQNAEGFPDCNPAVVTWHAHPYSCTKYILCFHGNPIERLCSPGLHFNPTFEQCMYPQLARCDINYACPSVDDSLNPVFLPDGDDCSSYFVCFQGSPIPRDCAPGLWWDVVYDWCTSAEEVTCDSRVPNNPNWPETEAPPTLPPTEVPPTEAPTLPPTEAPTESPTLPPTLPPTTLPTTTQNPNTYDCPVSSEPSFHPHSRECDLYFICINGMSFLRQCAAGMLFDIINRECDDREIATCISGAVTDDLPENRDLPTFFFKCPIHINYDVLFYPHNSMCNRYYACKKGIAYLLVCPKGQHYDVENEECRDYTNAICLNDL